MPPSERRRLPWQASSTSAISPKAWAWRFLSTLAPPPNLSATWILRSAMAWAPACVRRRDLSASMWLMGSVIAACACTFLWGSRFESAGALGAAMAGTGLDTAAGRVVRLSGLDAGVRGRHPVGAAYG